ncbi:MAG TPA: branched-chain amino acid transaminase [Dehalococcoidales bacterium]|nr:branched-chain amino acid transaminase [Dehalococcoidales bacterium]
MPNYAYYNQKFMPLTEAKMGVMTNFMHYGTGVFEGIRGSWNQARQQLYLFRLKEHYERMLKGCKTLKIDLPYSADDMVKLTIELVQRSGLKESQYIRPLAYKSTEAIGVRLHNLKSDFLIFNLPWTRYLEKDICAVGVSSWRRPGNNFSIPNAKLTGQYINSAFTKTEAIECGYEEAIVLNEWGRVAEGSGENIFLVVDGKLVTPSASESILVGITRNSIIEIAARELGVETVERPVERGELYTCQEAFFTGTATNVAAIGSIDHRPVGNGQIGPITQKLSDIYVDIIQGNNPAYMHWCTPVF